MNLLSTGATTINNNMMSINGSDHTKVVVFKRCSGLGREKCKEENVKERESKAMTLEFETAEHANWQTFFLVIFLKMECHVPVLMITFCAFSVSGFLQALPIQAIQEQGKEVGMAVQLRTSQLYF